MPRASTLTKNNIRSTGKPVAPMHSLRTLLALALLSSSTFAADWPEFRGPNRNGIADVKSAPLEWDESKNIAWKVPIPGEGWSSPVVVKDRIYLTAAIPVEGSSPTNYWLSA